jgi:hypothetical protein
VGCWQRLLKGEIMVHYAWGPRRRKRAASITGALVTVFLVCHGATAADTSTGVATEITESTSSGTVDIAQPESVFANSVVPAGTAFDEPYGDRYAPEFGGAFGQGAFFRAWLSQGFTWNPDDPADGFNTPVTFNDFANDYQLNQLYLSLGRQAAQFGPAWDLGGQADLLFGTDYVFTTALGLETELDGTQRWNSDNGPRAFGAARYGLAMPQLFAEVYAPIGHGANVRLGHFYSIMGYESVMSTENFFYSHAYALQYGEPFTHTGMLATFHLASGATVNAGFTRGWDNWEDPNGQLGFLGGLNWRSRDGRTDFSIAVSASNEDAAGENARSNYSIVLAHRISGCLTYVFQHDFGVDDNAALQGSSLMDAKWYGINQYLLAELTPRLKFGLRAEWFRDQDNARVIAIPTDAVDGGNYFALTAGLNWSLTDFMILRPEFRWDWSDVESSLLGIGGPFDSFTKQDQITVATDLVIRY